MASDIKSPAQGAIAAFEESSVVVKNIDNKMRVIAVSDITNKINKHYYYTTVLNFPTCPHNNLIKGTVNGLI